LLSAIIGAIVSAIGTGMMFAGVAFSLLPPLLHTLFMISIQNKLVYVSLAMAIAAPLMALGGSIAFYVPYVPVLAYTLATITWIISVVEVMVAVPIIMLGVTYPQGHDLLGKAEQGAMLFFSVFLRPSLIVIGFMFSVMTVGVMMIIASVTIHPVMLQLFQNVGGMAEIGGVTKVVFILMTMIVYAIMLLNSVDYAFGFVFKLPATVMKWIGLPEIQAQEEQYMQEIRQGSSGTASELSNAAGGMTSGLQDKAIGLQKKV
jgi:conjugal transfer/type IV secretion protein DotA/TraY